MDKWYSKSIKEVENSLSTNINVGLDDKSVQENRGKYGPNKLKEKKKKNIFEKIIDQFKDFMIIILIISAIISSILGYLNNEGIIDGVIILIVVFVNAIIGVIQENKANNSLEALKKMTTHLVKVMRNGNILEIDAKDLVVGDIVYIETGNFISADIRLTSAINLSVNESSLTGESMSISKNTDVISTINTISDTKNMVFSGTHVTNGRGVGIVVSVGMNSEIGKIASMINEVQDITTPLKKKLEHLGKVLGAVAIIVCILMFIVGLLYNKDIVHLIMTSVAVAVAAIPEGLPAVFTIVLAIGVNRMARKNAIIKNLSSVETLGSTTIICSDKTGTLTENKMVIEEVFYNDILYKSKKDLKMSSTLERLIIVSILCNDSKVSKDNIIGDPTETAFIHFSKEFDIDINALNDNMSRVYEIPFDSSRKLMTTVNEFNDKYIVCVKGAVDEIIKISNKIIIEDNEYNINEYKNNIINTNEELASNALRVLGCAYKIIDKNPNEDNSIILEDDLTFIGMVGMMDPPRAEVSSSIMTCKKAGITPIMITGDHKITAAAIAMKLDIIDNMDQVIEGYELDLMDEEEFINNIYKYKVYARVAPKHKVRIVKCFQSLGEIVAMTGDGVNDAPALKNADIGIAMGITGTDVSKEAADVILTDDNFSSIVDAVFEGRRTFSNIVKAIEYLLSSNLAEIVSLFIAILLTPVIASFCGISDAINLVPLLPIHILWINLVTDSMPALSLSVDPASDDLMDSKVLENNKELFTKSRIIRIVYQGLLIGALTLIAFIIGLRTPDVSDDMKIMIGQTMAFFVLSFTQLTHIFNVRNPKKSIFKTKIFNNGKLIMSVLLSILLMLVIYFVPTLRDVFGIVSLSLYNTFVIIILSLLPIVVVEAVKLLKLNGE